MASPNSKATFKEYIKRALGAPVLEINVDDDQMYDRIDEHYNTFISIITMVLSRCISNTKSPTQKLQHEI